MEVVSLLLVKKKMDINFADVDGITPLFLASQEGHTEVVSLLLADFRIEGNKPKPNEATPFHVACSQGLKEVVSPAPD